MDYLWSEGGKMFLMAMLMLLASVGIGYLASKVGAGIGQGLRSSIFQKVVSFSNSEMGAIFSQLAGRYNSKSPGVKYLL